MSAHRRTALALISRTDRNIHAVELRGSLRFESHEYDTSAEDMGFEMPDSDGLWVCVGRWAWCPSFDYESQIDEGNHEVRGGKYRRLTKQEWARLASGRPLWRERWESPHRSPAAKRQGVKL